MKRLAIILILTFILIVIFDLYFNISWDFKREFVYVIPNELTIEYDSWKELKDFFDEIGYNSLEDLSNINIIVKRFPEDFNEAPTNVRKELFLKILVPIIRKVNSEIMSERKEILKAIKQKNSKVLMEYMKKYDAQSIDDLLLKVDIIPEDLAIAQAAIESAWGTSRFAQEANNIFGEWTFSPGTGIVPKNRPLGATYEIEIFDDLLDSMRSYALNLNKLPFYEDFRLIRAGKKKGHPADGLLRYSELGEEYVKIVKIVMEHLPEL
ncbi:glucosaminidase domain-containing protein [Thermosipho atlanticus]|uniref:Bax protein n=1 Tax=Thermosipho atlanticus DSM 15807 TaxID=1123380 RepID=A0A1M5QSG7_9BACT|nr:glucosaminidase domain-containing protein [Thermosipho atlanticus]SHH16796.1 Bax protein [Thermosipho atlanticus DSM 15807]